VVFGKMHTIPTKLSTNWPLSVSNAKIVALYSVWVSD